MRTGIAVLGTGPASDAAAAGPDASRHDTIRLDPAFGRTPWSVIPGPAHGFRIDVLAGHRSDPVHARALIAPTTIEDGVAVSDIPRLLRAAHRFDAAAGGWTPVLDAMGRTSIPGLYAPNQADPAAGARALQAALQDRAGPPPFAPLATHSPEAPATPVPDGILCPCEGLTRADLEAGIAAGAREMNQLKAFTRCGMGECQGRRCEDAAARLLAPHAGGRAAAGYWTRRVPLVPVPLAILCGDFTYADIPVPPPAPL